MVEIKKLIGGPGSAKTTTLIQTVSRLIASGYSPEQITYLAFTNAAADEARTRALSQVIDRDSEASGFRTIHSMCFRLLGLQPEQTFGGKHFSELSKLTSKEFDSVKYHYEDNPFEDIDTNKEGNLILNLYSIARNRLLDNPKSRRVFGLLEDNLTNRINSNDYEYIISKYEQYKQDNGLFDFNDMIEQCIKERLTPGTNILFVDEFQDLTALTIALINQFSMDCEKLYICGDDMQAIYGFTGAKAENFLTYPGQEQFLSISYRLPKSVLDYSKILFNRVKRKINRELQTVKQNAGQVIKIYDEYDLRETLKSLNGDTTFLLHRHKSGCNWYASVLLELGIPFRNRRGYDPLGYKQAKGFIALRRLQKEGSIFIDDLKSLIECIPSLINKEYKYLERGSKTKIALLKDQSNISCVDMFQLGFKQAFFDDLRQNKTTDILSRIKPEELQLYEQTMKIYGIDGFENPKVTISTIHGVKGAEADNVILCNQLQYPSMMTYLDNPDDELRIMYTGVTRAKENLYLLDKSSQYNFDF